MSQTNMLNQITLFRGKFPNSVFLKNITDSHHKGDKREVKKQKRLHGQTSVPVFEKPLPIMDPKCYYLGTDATLSNTSEQLPQIYMQNKN